MTSREIRPITTSRATLTVPGDKSVSHRSVILGSIAEGVTTIENFLTSEDCLATLRAMQMMGARIERSGTSVTIEGVGLGGLREPASVIDVGNAATGIRLLAGLCSGQPFRATLTGDASVRKRPMERIVEPLTMMGARIRGERHNTRAPLRIDGGDLRGIHYKSRVASAQVKSAVLLAGLFADGETTVTEPGPSRDHTERMLTALGANVTRHGLTVTVQPCPTLTARDVDVPGDLSSAAFFIATGALIPDSEIVVENAGVNPTRTGFLDALKTMGAQIELERERMCGAEPVADARVKTSALRGAEFAGDVIVRMIDELPLIALVASQAQGRTVVRDAAELRVKESDRIATVISELAKLGVHAETRPDGFVIDGPQTIKGGDCESHGDHRIAMTAAVAGLISEAPTRVHDIACVNTSFPTFWETLEAL